MAGKLRHLKPTLAPTGRTIRVRQLVGGDPKQSRLVDVQLGGREDRADFHLGYRRARLHGRFDQCGKRPRKNAVVCGTHGGAYAVRERNHSRLSSVAAGKLSGLARQLKRAGGIPDLTIIEGWFPGVLEHVENCRKQPQLTRDVAGDLARIEGMLDDLWSDKGRPQTPADLVKITATILKMKQDALRTKMKLEIRNTVPLAEFQRTIQLFIGLFRKYVRAEDQPALLEDLRLSTLCDEPLPRHGANGP